MKHNKRHEERKEEERKSEDALIQKRGLSINKHLSIQSLEYIYLTEVQRFGGFTEFLHLFSLTPRIQ